MNERGAAANLKCTYGRHSDIGFDSRGAQTTLFTYSSYLAIIEAQNQQKNKPRFTHQKSSQHGQTAAYFHFMSKWRKYISVARPPCQSVARPSC